jgi:hypothetical protein
MILGVVDDQLVVTQCNSSEEYRVEPSVIHWRLYPLSGLQYFARPNYGYDDFKGYAERKANGATVLRSDILTPGVEILLDNSGIDPDNLAGMTQKSQKFSACVDFIPVIPGSTIAFTGPTSNARGNFAARIHEYTEAYAPVRRGTTIVVNGGRSSLTLHSSTRYIRPSFGWLNAAGNDLYFADMDSFEITITPPSS